MNRSIKCLDAGHLWLLGQVGEQVGEQVVDVRLGKVNSAAVMLISLHAAVLFAVR